MIGGKSHISNNISRDIVNLGLTTKRLSGENRQDTNAAIIKEFYEENSPRIFVFGRTFK